MTYTLVLYLCWRDAGSGARTTPRAGIVSLGEVRHCPKSVEPERIILTEDRFTVQEVCWAESYRRLKLLRERPGWNQFSLSYDCEGV